MILVFEDRVQETRNCLKISRGWPRCNKSAVLIQATYVNCFLVNTIILSIRIWNKLCPRLSILVTLKAKRVAIMRIIKSQNLIWTWHVLIWSVQIETLYCVVQGEEADSLFLHYFIRFPTLREQEERSRQSIVGFNFITSKEVLTFHKSTHGASLNTTWRQHGSPNSNVDDFNSCGTTYSSYLW